MMADVLQVRDLQVYYDTPLGTSTGREPRQF